MQRKRCSVSICMVIPDRMVPRYLGVLLLLLCLQACSDQEAPYRQIHSSFSEATGLTVTDNSGLSQQLIAESLGVRVVVSNDGQWLLVEDMQLSSLVVVRAFHYEGDRYREIGFSEVRRRWEVLAEEVGIDFEDLIRPKVGIEGFGPGQESVQLHFRAETGLRAHPEIDSIVEIPLVTANH